MADNDDTHQDNPNVDKKAETKPKVKVNRTSAMSEATEATDQAHNNQKTTTRSSSKRGTKRQPNKPVDPALLDGFAQQVNALLQDFFGGIVDEEVSLDVLGLTSARSVELTNLVATKLGVQLPYDSLVEFCATPAIFRTYVVSRMAHNYSSKSASLQPSQKRHLSRMHPNYKITWATLGILQAILSVVLLLLCTATLLPIGYCWTPLADRGLYALVVPLYLVSGTTLLIVVKWIVVGRYRPRCISVPSWLYLQWWFVDRLVHLWEIWMGRFLLDTTWLAWVYVLLGAHVSISSNFKGFIREFDLVTVAPHATLDYPCTRARIFSSWEDMDRGPTMLLKPIVIGPKAVVRGMLEPGVVVGKRALVERLAVVPADAMIPERQRVAGNPAVQIGPAPKLQYYGWGLIGFLKTTWMVLDLWFFWSLVPATRYINREWFGVWKSWGIHDLGRGNGNATNDAFAGFTLGAFISFAFCYSILMLLSSVAVKFLLLGSRSPGRYREYSWQHFVDWAADYHYSMAMLGFQMVARNSRLANIILMMHGMNIDLASKVDLATFKPSQLDLIRMRRSTIIQCTFDIKQDFEFRTTLIKDSTIGYGSHIGPGVLIDKGVVAPLSIVLEDVDKAVLLHKNDLVSNWALYGWELVKLVLYGLFLVLFYIAIYPAYEYWMLFVSDAPGGLAWLVLTGSLVILTCAWGVVLLLLQWMALAGASEDKPHPWSVIFYNVHHSFVDTFQEWSPAWNLLYGTQLFNDILRFLGVSIHGRALLFPDRLFDFSLLTIDERSVVDGARLSGTNNLYENIQLGPSYASGIVYEGTLIMANGNTFAKRTGPWRAILLNAYTVASQLANKKKQQEDPHTTVI